MQGSAKKELPEAAEKLYEALLQHGEGRAYRISSPDMYDVAELHAELRRTETRKAVKILKQDGYLVPVPGDYCVFRPAPWDRVEDSGGQATLTGGAP